MPITAKFTGGLTSPYVADIIGNVAREEYARLADEVLIPDLREALPGHYGATVKKSITGRGLNVQMRIYSTAPGIKQIEEGRRPGARMPPLSVLLKFVQKKGLGANLMSVKSRRSLSFGIKRSRNRKTGQLRSRSKSLLAKQKSIAFAIGILIQKRGLPDPNSKFKPSHNLKLFATLKDRKAGEIDQMRALMRAKVTNSLNA